MKLVNDNTLKISDFIFSPDVRLHSPPLDILPRECNPLAILNVGKCSCSTKFVPNRHAITGEFTDFIEVDLEEVGCKADNSMSMRRQPSLPERATRGSSMNYPFWPGGLSEASKKATNDDSNISSFSNKKMWKVPPGFEHGYDLSATGETNVDDVDFVSTKKNSIDLLNNFENDMDVQEWHRITKSEEESLLLKDCACDVKIAGDLKDVDEQIMKSDLTPVLEISSSDNTQSLRTEWAEMIDISQPLKDFKSKIPCPAMTFGFELDEFQKQAILKLEEKQYVFVAAHTSAGKTVVAEYAIALSQRDLTRTIYTSPIKALSNQKYRDFRKTFKDVGLITGDLQINSTATCLIMTTEILRSMLYCGSDITRDLEYVIFDEVHYINNPERGHVWEEVFILLPNHVNIIMLSATVSNTMELADWVGSTKRRKVYVISTLKRPVPLLHYLYTGYGGRSKDDTFLLVNEHGRFLQQNYAKAVERKLETQAKWKANPARRNTRPKEDPNMWIGLIDFLRRNNKMPVVSFTLSRNRCDVNLRALQSVDLNTSSEKASVQKFFHQCLLKLKPLDRELPQVMAMKDSLQRGIGVHHSGILPILKEIVEMLFQLGFVKLLFATETFAMGVNMPARTVIFNSHKKFDGADIRNLKPGEYIQMAGRAGRRGHDENGTVIILCHPSVPPAVDLRSMILGQPEKLESQFILRYAMILTCLRIESIKVEDIMQFSFKEFNQKLQEPLQQKQLKIAQDALSDMPELGEHLQPLSRFFELATEYLKERQRFMKRCVNQPKIVKELKVGKVVIVTKGYYYNRLGIILQTKFAAGKDAMFKALVLDNQFVGSQSSAVSCDEAYCKMVSLVPQNRFWQPDGIGGHTILDVKIEDIVEISTAHIKVDGDVIIRNWEQRQIERFKNTAPSASVVKAVCELQQLNDGYIAQPHKLKFVAILREANNLTTEEMGQARRILDLRAELDNTLPYTNTIYFEEQFAVVYERKVMERRIIDLTFLNSTKSLSLYTDYCSKLHVLRALKFIDDWDEVTLKGKVACEMGQNELLLTELILCNMFNDLEPAEIAALLSGLVFQSNLQKEPTIPDKFQKFVKEFMEIDQNISREELAQQVVVESDCRLNFGLLQVVYEWACKKPFAEIMKLTSVQEGIIVRCIQQLDEILHSVKTAAIRIGNPTLQSKMAEASDAIKRDIVFTASLYTEL